MRKRNKLTAVILAAILCSSAMLAACGNDNGSAASGSADTSSEKAGQAESSATDSQTKQDAESTSSEKAELTVWSNWTSDMFSNQGETPYWQAIAEACNVSLTFLDVTGGKDTLAVLVGSDDLPDIIIEFEGNLPGGGSQKLLLDEAILDLGTLMESGHMPYFKAYLESDPEADKLCKNDNGQYAWAPMIRKPDSPLVFNGNMIRKDWLDELNLEMPVTIQEMEDVLLAFKEQKGCDTGYAVAWNVYSRMVNAYGIFEETYIGADNKIHYGAITDEYLQFLTLFNRWIELGILDPDFYTQDYDTFCAKIASGRTGMVWGNTGGEFGKIETMKSEVPEMNYVAAPNPVQNKGDAFPCDISNYRVNNIGGMISSSCENPEAAAKVLDYVYGEEGEMLSNFGEEGTSYEMVNGKPQFTEYVLNNPDGLSIENALSLYAGNKNKVFLVSRDYMLGTYALDVQKESLDVWATPDGKIKALPPLSYTDEETAERSSIYTDIKTYVDEQKQLFIQGTRPLSEFPQFVESVKEMGIDRVVEIDQAAYERYCDR